MSTYFLGKTVLITGASSGIGEYLSRLLAQQGANLVLIGRNLNALNSLKSELESTTSVAVHSLDISDAAAVKAFASEIDTNNIDVLINNAGIACCDRFENLSEADYRAMIDTNYLGQVWMTRALLPGMKNRKAGHIVNVASMAGIIGIAGYTAYSASKYALVGFSESLRNELSGTGINVTLVLPSDIDTPQLHKENQTKPEATTALSGNIKPLSVKTAAMKILNGVAQSKKEMIVSPLSGRIQLWLCRLFPRLSKSIMDHKTKPFNN